VPGNDLSAALARKYVAATLGVDVEEWDRDGRQGAYDLRCELNGRSVAVEAKSVVDEDFRRMGARISALGYVREERLGRLWVVYLRHGADVRAARRGLPALLGAFETRGWDNSVRWRLALADDERLDEEADRLAVTGAWSHEPTEKHPPGFYVQPESWGDWPGARRDLSSYVGDLLGDEDSGIVRDLRRQLGAAHADERHAFLVVGWEFTEGWSLTDPEIDLPAEPPRLPSPIDGVWLASFSSGTRVVAWLPGRGWIEGRREPGTPGRP
jgi:hypothetical protein